MSRTVRYEVERQAADHLPSDRRRRRPLHRWIVRLIAGAILVGWLGLGYAALALTVSPVAVIGDPTPLGGTFAKFEDRPNINEAGDVVFIATVAGGKAPRAIFLAAQGALTAAVAEGDSTPVGGTFQRFRLGRSAPARSGAALFIATMAGGRVQEGIFLASKGIVTKVVAGGDSTPSGGVFGHMDERPSASDQGGVAFIAEVVHGKTREGRLRNRPLYPLIQPVHSPAGADMGIFLATQGGIVKVVRLGDPTPLGGTFDGFEPPIINGRGALVFIGSISGGSTPEAVFQAAGGTLTPVLRAGDPAPGGGKFGKLEAAGINDRGEIPFRVSLEGARGTAGVYLFSQGSVKKIAAAGDSTSEGRVFDGFIGRPMANGRGAIAFKAALHGGGRGTGREGIFVAVDGGLVKVVADVDDTPVGGTFGSITPPFLSDSGAIVFRASVVGGRTSEGIFVAK